MPTWEYCIVVQQLSVAENPNEAHLSVYRRLPTLEGDSLTIIWQWNGNVIEQHSSGELHTVLWRYIARLGVSGWEMYSVTAENYQMPSSEQRFGETKYYFKRQIPDDPVIIPTTIQKPKRTRKPKAGKTE